MPSNVTRQASSREGIQRMPDRDRVVIKLGKRTPSGAFRLTDDALARVTSQRSAMTHPRGSQKKKPK